MATPRQRPDDLKVHKISGLKRLHTIYCQLRQRFRRLFASIASATRRTLVFAPQRTKSRSRRATILRTLCDASRQGMHYRCAKAPSRGTMSRLASNEIRIGDERPTQSDRRAGAGHWARARAWFLAAFPSRQDSSSRECRTIPSLPASPGRFPCLPK